MGKKRKPLFRKPKGEEFIAFDPSLRSAGWAVFSSSSEKVSPLETGLFKTKTGNDWQEAGSILYKRVCELLERKKETVKDFYCENPAFFDMTVADTGSLVKLAWSTGILAGACFERGIHFHPVDVCVWKGQLSKKVVNLRISKILGEENCRNFKADIWDAVGIGLFIKEVF